MLAAETAFYIVLGLVILTPDAVYSGDIGVKFVQARALAAHRFVSLDIPYPGAFLDPNRRFFALRAPFVMRAGAETQAIFPPASAVVQAIAVAFGGVEATFLAANLSKVAHGGWLPLLIALLVFTVNALTGGREPKKKVRR